MLDLPPALSERPPSPLLVFVTAAVELAEERVATVRRALAALGANEETAERTVVRLTTRLSGLRLHARALAESRATLKPAAERYTRQRLAYDETAPGRPPRWAEIVEWGVAGEARLVEAGEAYRTAWRDHLELLADAAGYEPFMTEDQVERLLGMGLEATLAEIAAAEQTAEPLTSYRDAVELWGVAEMYREAWGDNDRDLDRPLDAPEL